MINKAIILGRVGSKKYQNTKNGSTLCRMSIATNKRYIDSKGNAVQKTTWHFVNCFKKLADIANQIANIGDLLYIEGEIDIKREVDSEGREKTYYSISADLIQIIPTGKKDHVSGQDASSTSIGKSYEPNRVSEMLDDESIPY